MIESINAIDVMPITSSAAAMRSAMLPKSETRSVAQRQANVEYLSNRLAEIPAIEVASVRPGCSHVYYLHTARFNEAIAGVSRNRFVAAVRAELPTTTGREQDGALLSAGYCKPLYYLPLFQEQIAYGSNGYPFSEYSPSMPSSYNAGSCPVVERVEDEIICHELMTPGMSPRDLDDVASAFEKVWDGRNSLVT